jgi:hypothetical protein
LGSDERRKQTDFRGREINNLGRAVIVMARSLPDLLAALRCLHSNRKSSAFAIDGLTNGTTTKTIKSVLAFWSGVSKSTEVFASVAA